MGGILIAKVVCIGIFCKKNLLTYMGVERSILLNVPGGIRTPDLLVRSQTLYPAELRAHILFFVLRRAG